MEAALRHNPPEDGCEYHAEVEWQGRCSDYS